MIDVDRIEEEARSQTGLEDFGSDAWRADIAVLLDGPSSQSPAQRVAAAAELAERRAAETERMHS